MTITMRDVYKRQDQIGLIDLRLFEDIVVAAVSLNADDIQHIHRQVQHLRFVFDDRDIISLMAQLLGDREADLAIPDDDDFHVLPSFLMVCTAFAHTFYYNLPNCPDIIDKNRKETKKKRQRTAM